MMRIAGIGDLFIPAIYIKKGFAPWHAAGHVVDVMDWPLESFQALQAINLQVEKFGSDAVEPPDIIYEFCAEADVIVTQFCTITKKLIDACPRLKAVGILRSGVENVNAAYLEEKGIRLFHTPGRNADSVSDFTIGLMLCEARNIARGHLGMKKGQWIREYPNSGSIPDLRGRTVGLIGCGAIGRKVAEKLRGFDMRILGYDPFANHEGCRESGILLTDLDSLLSESDFISIHARLTIENHHLINDKRLRQVKRGAYLINTSRAGLIDEVALYNALCDGTLAGAALDVFEHEPPGADDPLVSLPNVTVTPHMAGGSNDAFYNTPALLRASMDQWLHHEI